MSSEEVIAGYLRIAKQDLEGAVALDQVGNRNSIYLCSQAAEKVIRAVLTSESIHAGISHQLDLMIDQVPDENPIKPLLREVQSLSVFATAFRYPTSTRGRIRSHPVGEEFASYVSKVERALNEALARFDVDLEDEGKAAGNADPIR